MKPRAARPRQVASGGNPCSGIPSVAVAALWLPRRWFRALALVARGVQVLSSAHRPYLDAIIGLLLLAPGKLEIWLSRVPLYREPTYWLVIGLMASC